MRFLIFVQVLVAFGDLIGFNRFANTVAKHRGGKLKILYFGTNSFNTYILESYRTQTRINIGKHNIKAQILKYYLHRLLHLDGQQKHF